MPKLIDLIGKRFGRLVVLKKSARDVGVVNTRARWLCRCDCGRKAKADSGNLRNGITQSCGCLRREVTAKNHHKHGHAPASGTSLEYNSWKGMLTRCFNKNTISYRYYGARGITVCGRWRYSFANFISDMGPRPKGMTIERINNDGDYEPNNCKWATYLEQNHNKRKQGTCG